MNSTDGIVPSLDYHKMAMACKDEDEDDDNNPENWVEAGRDGVQSSQQQLKELRSLQKLVLELRTAVVRMQRLQG